MRRVLSIVLALFFGLGPLTSTLQASDDMRLPPCCRRHGAHHCAMADAMMARMAQAAQDRTPAFTAPSHCPYYPGSMHATVRLDQALTAVVTSTPLLHAKERIYSSHEVTARTSNLRARTGRSPPSPSFC